MPTLYPTPALIIIAGGEASITPVFFQPLPGMLTIVGGQADIGPQFGTDLAGKKVRLDRLTRVEEISKGSPVSPKFQALWQRNTEAIEQAFTDQSAQIELMRQMLAGLIEAQNTATEAVQQAQETEANVTLANSNTVPIDGILTATSGGVISIAAHQRDYRNGTVVSVNGGAVSGFAPGEFVRVKYADAARAGGSVVFEGTTAEVTQTGDTHVVGGVMIPALTDPPATGIGTTPPGYIRGIDP